MPKEAATGSFAPALGVGGFVTEVPSASVEFNLNRQARTSRPVIPGIQKIDPEIVGGTKIYVHPSHARIDPKGRVVLSVVPADEEAIAVAEGTTDQIPGPPPTPPYVERSTRVQAFKNAEEAGGYGLSLSEQGRQRHSRRRLLLRRCCRERMMQYRSWRDS